MTPDNDRVLWEVLANRMRFERTVAAYQVGGGGTVKFDEEF